MSYYRQDEKDTLAERGGKFLLLVFIAIVVAIAMLLMWSADTQDQQRHVYEYDGPDGTLMGVPYELQNHVIYDHDTGVYYFLLTDRQRGIVTLCPRYNADGTLWTNPLRSKEAG